MKAIELENLLKEMSLEEKVMQLVQVPGSVYAKDSATTGIMQETVPEKVRRLAGSTLGIMDGGKIRDIQDEYMKHHPHHIPLLFMLDVIHGHKTVFPCPLGQGATFDPDLTEQAAAIQAEEAAADGVHVTFSPMADLVRDARWGRVMESTGEDPLLNGRMAAAMVHGYQGPDLKDGRHVASCVKHFAAYGAADGGRDYNNTELSEHTLRDSYLPAYQEAIQAGARMVMSSFNSWNGIPVTGSEWLMKKILREEMGFEGVTISDWDAIGQLIPHGYAEDLEDAARKAMRAGVDIDMTTGAYAGYLEKLVREGRLPESELDKAVLRILTLKNDLGLFENPCRGLTEHLPVHTPEEKHALARKAAAESLVLLKNEDGVLPLKAKKLAFIGPYAMSRDLHSTWAINPDKAQGVSVWDAAQEMLPEAGVEVRAAQGCDMVEDGTGLSFFVYHDADQREKNQKWMAEALEAAAWADTAVLCLGEHLLQSGESTSRAKLTLPQCQLELLRRVKEVCGKVIVLLFCGRPLEVAQMADHASALVVCWRPGTEGGHGILDVLTGKVPPSGCLPMSFPHTVGQEPLHYDEYSTGRPRPSEGNDMFTSRYLDCANSALFPFGFGLSYGKAEISPVELSGSELREGEHLTARAFLTNHGDEKAAHTVQLYIQDLVGSRVRPVRQLRDFHRVLLEPGETREIAFRIEEPMLRFWRADQTYGSEPGRFRVWISLNSRDGDPVEFHLR